MYALLLLFFKKNDDRIICVERLWVVSLSSFIFPKKTYFIHIIFNAVLDIICALSNPVRL